MGSQVPVPTAVPGTLGLPGSHHTGLDVLVGDLLVVVGAAAGGMHGGGRHGVEREDKLFSVTHAG